MSPVSSRTAYRAAIALAVVTLLLLVWLSLGVGIIGKDGDPTNVVYGLVVLIGIVGASAARLRPHGMARTLIAMAVVQALIGAGAAVLGLGYPYSPALELIGLTAIFVALFAASALLFRRAAQVVP